MKCFVLGICLIGAAAAAAANCSSLGIDVPIESGFPTVDVATEGWSWHFVYQSDGPFAVRLLLEGADPGFLWLSLPDESWNPYEDFPILYSAEPGDPIRYNSTDPACFIIGVSLYERKSWDHSLRFKIHVAEVDAEFEDDPTAPTTTLFPYDDPSLPICFTSSYGQANPAYTFNLSVSESSEFYGELYQSCQTFYLPFEEQEKLVVKLRSLRGNADLTVTEMSEFSEYDRFTSQNSISRVDYVRLSKRFFPVCYEVVVCSPGDAFFRLEIVDSVSFFSSDNHIILFALGSIVAGVLLWRLHALIVKNLKRNQEESEVPLLKSLDNAVVDPEGETE